VDTLLHFIRNLYEHGYRGDPGLVGEEFYVEQLAELLRILGFTQEDVRAIREAAAHHAGAGTEEHLVVGLQLHSLANRLEALLPPEDPLKAIDDMHESELDRLPEGYSPEMVRKLKEVQATERQALLDSVPPEGK